MIKPDAKYPWPTLEGRLNQPQVTRAEALRQLEATLPLSDTAKRDLQKLDVIAKEVFCVIAQNLGIAGYEIARKLPRNPSEIQEALESLHGQKLILGSPELRENFTLTALGFSMNPMTETKIEYVIEAQYGHEKQWVDVGSEYKKPDAIKELKRKRKLQEVNSKKIVLRLVKRTTIWEILDD